MTDMREAVARALAKHDRIEICSDASYALSSYGPKADAALSIMQPEIDRRVAEERKAQDDRIDALEAALRDVFIHGHSEGWRGNQMRRDVMHEDAEKSWSLYVSNGALEKTIARKALESQP